MRRFPLGVFTGHGPGLKLANLGLITPGSIAAIDFHVEIDSETAEAEIDALPDVLAEHNLLLDAIVFGLPGEIWGPKPANAIENVGFAAPGTPRRQERFAYATRMAQKVAEVLTPQHFIRGQLTMKGHFGCFDPKQANRYNNLQVGLQKLRADVLKPNNFLFLAETGLESAANVIALLESIGTDVFRANWDTANLALWGAQVDNFEYARALAEAGVLHGVHLKAGIAAAKAGEWGHETEPNEAFVRSVLTLLSEVGYDGPVTGEREMFLGEQREDQNQKAAGLNATLALALGMMPAE